MGFRCDLCGVPQSPNIKPRKIFDIRLVIKDVVQTTDPRTRLAIVFTRTEEQIIKEKQICPNCAKTNPGKKVVEVRDECDLIVSKERAEVV
ncbi:MAG: hypothetical protein ABH805_02490 [Candidatus Nealsonbacteria bacterium]